jgi:hypothetical protein
VVTLTGYPVGRFKLAREGCTRHRPYRASTTAALARAGTTLPVAKRSLLCLPVRSRTLSRRPGRNIALASPRLHDPHGGKRWAWGKQGTRLHPQCPRIPAWRERDNAYFALFPHGLALPSALC